MCRHLLSALLGGLAARTSVALQVSNEQATDQLQGTPHDHKESFAALQISSEQATDQLQGTPLYEIESLAEQWARSKSKRKVSLLATAKKIRRSKITRMPGKFEDWQSWSELIHLRENNFVFCALPKSACTLWKQLMLKAGGKKHWNTKQSEQIHNPQKSGLELVGVKPGMHTRDKAGQNESDILDLLNAGETVETAVMVRDPVTRILSTYLDRCVDMGEWHRCFAFDNKPISFEQTIGNIEAQRKAGVEIPDVHIKNQSDMCGLRYMNFSLIGHMEHFYDDSRFILEAAGLWDRFGEQGWGPEGKTSFGEIAQKSSNHKKHHNTTRLICKHYTPELLERVHELYKPDFERFNYKVETWETACKKIWKELAKKEAKKGKVPKTNAQAKDTKKEAQEKMLETHNAKEEGLSWKAFAGRFGWSKRWPFSS